MLFTLAEMPGAHPDLRSSRLLPWLTALLWLAASAVPARAQEATEEETPAEEPAEGEEAEGVPEEESSEEESVEEVVEEEEEFVEMEEYVPRPTLDPGRLLVAQRRGAVVYAQYCAACHGRRGDGLGAAARFLQVAPRNFTTGVYKWRTTPTGELPTDSDLLRTVRRGVPGTAMPGWDGRLPLRDMWATVQYIKTFSPRFLEGGRMMPIPMPDAVPAFDDEMRQSGRLVYILLSCWTCHGMDGTGNGPASDTLVDDDGNPIVAYDFTQGQMRGGTRPIDIYRTFTSGVNGTPMPSYDEAIVVGRDGYTDFSTFEPVLSREGMQRFRQFVASLPTTEELWALPEQERLAWGIQKRWDLVAYVLSLSSGNTAWRYLWTAPYTTE